MPVYWSLNQIPELEGFSWRQRRNIFRTCARRHNVLNAPVTGQNIFAVLSVIVVFFGGEVLVFPVLRLDEYSDPLSALMMLLVAVISWFIFSRFQINYLRPFYPEIAQKELKGGHS